MTVMDEMTIFVGPKDRLETQPIQEEFVRKFDERLQRTTQLLLSLLSAGLLNGLDIRRQRYQAYIIVKGTRDLIEKLMSALDISYPEARYSTAQDRTISRK